MTYELAVGGRTVLVSIRSDPDGGYRIAIDGGPERLVNGGPIGAAEWWIADEHGRRAVAVHVRGEQVHAQVRGFGLTGTIRDPRAHRDDAGKDGAEGTILTPIPGAVARVLVAVGDVVQKGQVLVVVEAMKMENEFRSPFDGVVVEVLAKAGTTVEGNTALARVEARP